MKKLEILSKKLSEVKQEAFNLYNEILSKKGEIDFRKRIRENENNDMSIVEKILNDVTTLPIIQFRNEITGNVIDCYVLKVDADGILVKTFDNDMRTYQFDDADIDDQISLLNEMIGG